MGLFNLMKYCNGFVSLDVIQWLCHIQAPDLAERGLPISDRAGGTMNACAGPGHAALPMPKIPQLKRRENARIAG